MFQSSLKIKLNIIFLVNISIYIFIEVLTDDYRFDCVDIAKTKIMAEINLGCFKMLIYVNLSNLIIHKQRMMIFLFFFK